MNYRSAGKLTPDALGHRVTVRRRLDSGGASDTVGTLTAIDPTSVTVRDKNGTDIQILVADMVAFRVILPPKR